MHIDSPPEATITHAHSPQASVTDKDVPIV
jgi:hypothetical protein